MGLSLVTGPTQEPVTLAEAKQHCRIDSTDEDGLLAGIILAARIYCEGETRRAFLTQTVDYTIDYQWPYLPNGYCRGIILPLGNLQSVTSISYVDQDGVTQVLSSTQYTVRTDETSGQITEAYGATWPSVRTSPSAITVRCVVGWLPSQFPDDLRQALLMLVGAWYENRETVVTGSAFTPSALPMATEAILSRYRISRIL